MRGLSSKVFYEKKYKRYSANYKKMDKGELDYEYATLRAHLLCFQGLGLLLSIFTVPLGIFTALNFLTFKIGGYMCAGMAFLLILTMYSYSLQELRISIIENLKSR
jgi:hypothetical protein